MTKLKLNDGARLAHQNLLRSDAFREVYSMWDKLTPGISVTGADGKADLTTTALTGARAEGYRQAMRTFLTLSEQA